MDEEEKPRDLTLEALEQRRAMHIKTNGMRIQQMVADHNLEMRKIAEEEIKLKEKADNEQQSQINSEGN